MTPATDVKEFLYEVPRFASLVAAAQQARLQAVTQQPLPELPAGAWLLLLLPTMPADTIKTS